MPEETKQFHSLAQGVAKIILENSWEANEVRSVLLYGSTLKSPSPRDIDLLILHFMGASLENYTTSRSKCEEGEDVHYYPASVILWQLGYKEGKPQDTVSKRVHELFRERGMLQEAELGNMHPPIINQVLDLHVLNTLLIQDPSFLGEKHREYYQVRLPHFREKAIRMSGKDPNFFHRVLSEGRLYNQQTGDFTVSFEEIYPGKLELFCVD